MIQLPFRAARTTALAAFVALAAPAAAHVEATITEARPGDRIEIALEVGHGCAGAPTTALRVAAPPGLDDVEPVALPGWEVTRAAGEIGWSGGELPDSETGIFVFAATVAADAEGQIVVPIVQICGEEQIRWIDPNPHASNPAPSIRILPPT